MRSSNDAQRPQNTEWAVSPASPWAGDFPTRNTEDGEPQALSEPSEGRALAQDAETASCAAIRRKSPDAMSTSGGVRGGNRKERPYSIARVGRDPTGSVAHSSRTRAAPSVDLTAGRMLSAMS